jgi:hypothetical protein
MGLAVISGEGAPDVRDALERLQLEQFRHDETYHREIARLSTQDRLKHFALHFAKYAGNLAEEQADRARVQRVVVDVFVIATSCANTLNLRLPEALSQEVAASEPAGDAKDFLMALTINAGKMAAACEKLDHLEEFPFRATIRAAALALIQSSILFAEARGWNLEDLVHTRLAAVKEKMIFHGQV